MFKPDLMRGQRVLITGGGTGLGKSMAAKCLSLGANVVICGRRKEVCDEAAAQLVMRHGGIVDTFGIDIRDAAAVDAMVGEIFSSEPLTALVNNAAGNFISPTEALSPRGFDAIANIVMHGTFYVTQAVGKHWIAGGWKPGDPMRSVMSIVVTWIDHGGPFVVPSTMSKSAVDAMTKSLATEWARYGIRLNTVGPGEIPTDGMSKRLTPGEIPGERIKEANPMGRHGTLDELGNLAAFLLAPGCDWLTGQSIMFDGGQYLTNPGTFYELRKWSSAQWRQARQMIQHQNDLDKSARGANSQGEAR